MSDREQQVRTALVLAELLLLGVIEEAQIDLEDIEVEIQVSIAPTGESVECRTFTGEAIMDMIRAALNGEDAPAWKIGH